MTSLWRFLRKRGVDSWLDRFFLLPSAGASSSTCWRLHGCFSGGGKRVSAHWSAMASKLVEIRTPLVYYLNHYHTSAKGNNLDFSLEVLVELWAFKSNMRCYPGKHCWKLVCLGLSFGGSGGGEGRTSAPFTKKVTTLPKFQIIDQRTTAYDISETFADRHARCSPA